MKQVATQAIILKRINFGEADRILTVLSKDSGQLSLLAKGVRKSKSKLAGGLELFSVSDINYIDGKSDLKTVVSTRLQAHYKNIVADVNRTMAGYDFMKIIDGFTQHSNEPGYYVLLKSGLESLDEVSLPVTVTEVWFFMHLLLLHGSGINLEKPLEVSEFSKDKTYSYSYDDMSFFESNSGEFTPNHIKFLRLVVRSSLPEKLKSIAGYSKLSSDLQTITKQSAMMHRA
jgi:DNA repair protein RecO (recombination protein O)